MKSQLLVGCCGFPTSLIRYAQAFPVVEVQQTFYQPPVLPTLERWRRAVGGEFEFALKAWQLITHEASSPTYRRLREKLTDRERREAGAFRLNATVIRAWRRTLECARAVGTRCVLFQCPARFAPTPQHKENLRAFFREIRAAARDGEPLTYIWEPRGEWQPEEVQGLCEELGLAHGVDPFKQNPVTVPLGYFRLHGRAGYRYHYTERDFDCLWEMVQKRRPCYVFFNNISMLEDAKRFQRFALAHSARLSRRSA